ncbi:sulfurtransferase [Serinibacter arcticus]|uniref:Sulfurtransferase n=1 Tax=Serinibacter arcticus TaxID=1655435 RepID=A0A2U1ZXD6_9MICO|nr:rhodanese-like domain-containing protein [Serinibacter arcticus]PWD51610.1 sulfurtransferase [Serinibacter arcticus]
MTTPHPHVHGYAGDLTPQEAWTALEGDADAVLVDVRTPQEWAQVGIPDLTELDREPVLDPLQTFLGPNPDFLATLTAAGLEPGDGRTLVFLCKSGVRSIAAAQLATSAGFGPAYNVVDGYEGQFGPGWAPLGLPVAAYEGDR